MVNVQREQISILKDKNATLSTPIDVGQNILSRHIVTLDVPKTFKASSSTTMLVSSPSAREASCNTEIETSNLSDSLKSRKMLLKTDNSRSGITKQILMQEATNSGKITKKTTVIKTKKLYTKTLPKMSNLSDSSSYCVSRGQVIYEEFWDSDIRQELSSSLSSYSNCHYTPHVKAQGNIKMVGIRNVNYQESKFSGAEETCSYKAPRFEPICIPESEKESNVKKIPNMSIAFARKTLSSQVFLSSLTPPSDDDLAAYNKKKIKERKEMVLNQWIENNKKNLKAIPLFKRKGYVKALS